VKGGKGRCPLDILLNFAIITAEFRSPIPLPGGKVRYGDFETLFLDWRGMRFRVMRMFL
jgi:hypothetical protein